MPYTFDFDNLAIEVTRRCNMRCEHCIRGEPQDKDLNPEAVDRLLRRTGEIGTLTLTGGEPSLNPSGIHKLRESLHQHYIGVQDLFLATNGKDVSDEFLTEVFQLLLMTSDSGLSSVALSTDAFHEPIPQRNLQKLRTLAAFDAEQKRIDWRRIGPIRLGRAKTLTNLPLKNPDDLTNNLMYSRKSDKDVYSIEDADITLTVDGDLLRTCDYEYNDKRPIKICNVFDTDWTERLAAAIEAESA